MKYWVFASIMNSFLVYDMFNDFIRRIKEY